MCSRWGLGYGLLATSEQAVAKSITFVDPARPQNFQTTIFIAPARPQILQKMHPGNLQNTIFVDPAPPRDALERFWDALEGSGTSTGHSGTSLGRSGRLWDVSGTLQKALGRELRQSGFSCPRDALELRLQCFRARATPRCQDGPL